MKIIKKLSEMISEEISDADKYARCALAHKEDHPELADVFYALAGEELAHASTLHEAAAKMITQYRKTHGDPPEPMQAVYDYLHEQQIEKTTEVKLLRAMYKE